MLSLLLWVQCFWRVRLAIGDDEGGATLVKKIGLPQRFKAKAQAVGFCQMICSSWQASFPGFEP